MPICVLKREDLCDRMSTNKIKLGQILASKRGKFARQRNKMAANFSICSAQAAQRKHKIRLVVSHCRPRQERSQVPAESKSGRLKFLKYTAYLLQNVPVALNIYIVEGWSNMTESVL